VHGTTESEMGFDDDGEPIRVGSDDDVFWITACHVALPRGARVHLLGPGVPLHLRGHKEGRVVESPVPTIGYVPPECHNIGLRLARIGRGIVSVRLSASDEIRLAPGQCIAALE